jgi:hypothetical protein
MITKGLLEQIYSLSFRIALNVLLAEFWVMPYQYLYMLQWAMLFHINLLNILEFLRVVFRKSPIFWNITLCRLLKVNWCFRGTFHLHLQGQRTSQAINQCEAGSKHSSGSACYLLHDGFLLGLFFNPEDGSNMFLQNDESLPAGYAVLYPSRQNSLLSRLLRSSITGM